MKPRSMHKGKVRPFKMKIRDPIAKQRYTKLGLMDPYGARRYRVGPPVEAGECPEGFSWEA